MDNKTAGDLMVSLDEYPVIDASASVLDAVMLLDESRRKMDSGRQPFQAVLVSDEKGRIVGKLGQLAILKSLEPSRKIFDQRDLTKAGVSESIVKAALDQMRAFQNEFSDMCRGVADSPVSSAMHPFNEHIDIAAPVREVIHYMVEWQTLSILVTENNQPVGLVRLSDLCDEVIKEMHRSCSGGSG
jgi:signal-transduction protein with cAMP-binding, CBS, and nucleotidyltransferase domain